MINIFENATVEFNFQLKPTSNAKFVFFTGGSTRKGRKESCIELSSNAPPIIAGASKHSPLDEDEE